MSVTQIADIADLIAALGIVVTLGFPAFETRKNTRQAKIMNWHVTMQSIKETRRRTDSPHLADVVERDRRSFGALSAAEKITFGFFLEEMLLDYDPFIVHGNEIAVGRRYTLRAVKGAYSEFLGHPGAIEWWEQSGPKNRWPPHIVKEIEEAVADVKRGMA